MVHLYKDSNGIFLSRKDQTLIRGQSSSDPQKYNILLFLKMLYEIAKKKKTTNKAEDED